MTATRYTGLNMTTEEKERLREWVEAGNSVHDNPWCMVGEDGRPLDFITAWRDMLDLKKQYDAGL